MKFLLAYIALFLIGYSNCVYGEQLILLPDKDSEFALVLDENLWIHSSKSIGKFYTKQPLQFYSTQLMIDLEKFKGKEIAYKVPIYGQISKNNVYEKFLEVEFFHFDHTSVNPLSYFLEIGSAQNQNSSISLENHSRFILQFICTANAIYNPSFKIKYLGSNAFGKIFENHVHHRLHKEKRVTFRLYMIYTEPYCDEQGVYHKNGYYIFIINRTDTPTDDMERLCKPIIDGIVPIVRTSTMDSTFLDPNCVPAQIQWQTPQ